MAMPRRLSLSQRFTDTEAPMRHFTAAALAVLVALSAAPAAAANDYPTEARVDYVIGCMGANGSDRITMQKCACSIDTIAEQIPYDDYVAVETIKVMSEQPGERAGVFRDSGWAKDLVDTFRQAQVAADLQCF